MRGRFFVAVAAGCLLLGSGGATADVVRLKGGDALEGTAKDLGESVRVTTPTATVELPWSAVEAIRPDATLAGELEARRAAVAEGDAGGLHGLAVWAARQGLETEARELAAAVVALEPDHAGARSLLDGKGTAGEPGRDWKSGTALLESKGLVHRDGRWILRSEAEALDRRAAREKEATEEERRAGKLLESLGDRTPAVRRYAAEALATVDPALRRRLFLVGARHRNEAVRAASVAGLGTAGDDGVLRTLLHAAVKDPSAEVRAAAGASLRAVGNPDVVRPLARALHSENAAIRVNAADALGAFGDRAAVETVIRRVMWAAGPSNRANIQVLNQVSYIRDYDVEIAQLSQIGDPIIGILQEGVVLDVKVMGATGTDVEIERRAYARALHRLTGKDFGTDAGAWARWWEAEGKREYAAERR